MESGTVWNKYVHVGLQSHRTELYGIDAHNGEAMVGRGTTKRHGTKQRTFTHNSGNAVVQIVIVPGNPGSALFYIPFLKLVYAELDGRADVVVFSHLAHDLKSPHGSMVGTLARVTI